MTIPNLSNVIAMPPFLKENWLDALSLSGQLTLEPLLDMAVQLAYFHQEIEVITTHQHPGSEEHVWFPVAQNFDQIRPLLDQEEDIAQLARVEKWSSDRYQALRPLIREREGGTDSMADLGFLCVNMDARGLSELTFFVVNKYMDISGDFRGLGLLSFYRVYQALVQARIVLLRSYDDLNDQLTSQALAEYRLYANLAESYCQTKKPFLAIMQGLSGSGKTSAGRELVKHANCIMLRTDIERKRLFGLKPEASSHEAGLSIYTQDATQKTYLTIQEAARSLLNQGISVVIDGASLKFQERALCCQPAIELQYPYFIVKCMAPDDVLKRRIIKRQFNNTDASEATLGLIKQQRQWEEPLSDQEKEHTIVLNTTCKHWREKLLTDLSIQLN